MALKQKLLTYLLNDHRQSSSFLSILINRLFLHNKGLPLVHYRNSIFSHCAFKSYGRGNVIQIESGCYLRRCKIVFYGNNNSIYIGGSCQINDASISLEDNGNSLFIGSRFRNQGANISLAEGTTIKIGDDCLFSTELIITSSDHHSIINVTNKARVNKAKNISIGDKVWIGVGCTILKGTNIGSDTIVGAKSLVTYSDAESNIVLAGNPAKVVKKGISWVGEKI